MRAVTRVGASICLTVFSLVTIILLLPNSRISTHLQKITLGTTIDDLPTLWNWAAKEGDDEGGVTLVVFGDSWVDDSWDGENGKGKSWAEVLCEEINCASHLNFAVSQSPESYPSSAPAGAITSNNIYVSSLAASPSPPPEPMISDMLPDLAAQIKEFIAVPPPAQRPRETIFVVAFGFWDIYNFAGLDYGLGQNVTNRTITELFHQIDVLYSHYGQYLSSAYIDADESPSSNNSARNNTHTEARSIKISPFRLVIPKLFEPTLLPGWLSQRPVPLSPSSIAETQKNAAYLTTLWNILVEDKLGQWLKGDLVYEELLPRGEDSNTLLERAKAAVVPVEKDLLYYDLPKYLLDTIIEHQLEDSGLSDASGLGKGESPFKSVYQPCIREAKEGDTNDRYVDLNGQKMCKQPKEYLFWDSFNLGSVAKEAIGKEVGAMVRQGKSAWRIWS